MIVCIERVDSPAAQQSIAALDADLRTRYPDAPIFGIDVGRFEAEGGVFAVGYEEGVPVACGALRPFEKNIEIKRVYVVPGFRGRGLAKAIMAFLEAEAVRRGFSHAVLETGLGQPEAIALYRSLGWKEIPPYGVFAQEHRSACFKSNDDFRHVCFEKLLKAA